MQILGYVLSKGTIRDIPGYIKVIKNMEEWDTSSMLLIVGYDSAKSIIEHFTPLERIYQNGLIRWTFGKTENRGDYEQDLVSFYREVLQRVVNKCEYKYVNVVKVQAEDIERLIQKLDNSKPDILIWDGWRMKYLLVGDIIYGVNKPILTYCGLQDEFSNVIKHAGNIRYVSKEERDALNSMIKNTFDNCFKVYLYSKLYL